MSRVFRTDTRNIHWLAQCSQCDWDQDTHSGDGRSPRKVSADARKHCQETGHNVTVEHASSYHYEVSK